MALLRDNDWRNRLQQVAAACGPLSPHPPADFKNFADGSVELLFFDERTV